RTLATAPVTIQVGSDTDLITVGDGDMQGVAGNVSIVSVKGSGDAGLLLEDSGDAGGRTVTVNASSVTGLAPGTISFPAARLMSLTLKTGTQQNDVTVKDTPDNPGKPTTTILAGTGDDLVHVWRTTGGLEIDGGGSFAIVNVSFP